MNILFLTPRFPYPPVKGDQTVAYNRIRTLGKRHNVILLSFFETEDELQGIEHLQDFCKDIILIQLPKWKSILHIGLNFWRSSLPLQVLYYSGSQRFQESLERLIDDYQIDVVHCFLLRLVPYLENCQVPIILELIDSMQLNLKRRLTREPFLKKQVIQNEFQRICRYEPTIGGRVKYLIVVAEEDRKYIRSANVQIIHNGVDLGSFQPMAITSARKYNQIVFSGNMGYAPNQEAVLWFVQQCFSIIRKQIQDVEFCIVGKNPSSAIQELNKVNGIHVVGYVASMSEYISQAGIAIAPMQSGSGMQNKILEAMACGLPVVTTTLGLGSIRAVADKEIIVRDDPSTFSECIVELIQNRERILAIGKAARQYVEAYHSWEKAAERIESLYSSSKEGIADRLK